MRRPNLRRDNLLRPKPAALIAACAVMCLVPASALAHPARSPKPAPTYYLALGDSLAAGAQPTPAGQTVPTLQGYANDLLASQKSKLKGLKLKDLGCLGETTTSMLRGSRPLTRGLIAQADAIYVMTKSHLRAVLSLDPGAASKASLLDPEGREIDDPLGLPALVYTQTAGAIRSAIERRLREADA